MFQNIKTTTLIFIQLALIYFLASAPLNAADLAHPAEITSTTPTPQPITNQGQVRIVRPEVNLRSGPGTTYAVLATALQGQLFTVIGNNQDNSWYEIRIDNKVGTAWVAASLVERMDTTVSTSATVSKTTPSGAVITSPANTDLLYIAQTESGFEVRGIDAKRSAKSILIARSLSATPQTVTWSPKLDWLAFIEPAPWGPPQGTLKLLHLATAQELPLLGNPDYQKLVGDPKSQVDNNIMKAPAWSPDGTTIAFADQPYPASDGAIRYVLKLTDPAGANYRTLSEQSSTAIESPAWSPDGKWLAFRADNGLWLVDSLGKQTRQLVNIELGEDVRHSLLDISWSPDGKKILFAANLKDANTNRFDIYSIQPDGAGLTNLTNSPAAERFPTWSPDGKQIAYQYPYRNKYGVYVMRANGQEPASLVGHEFAWIDHFRWSPDGKRLAFAAQAESNFDLYIVDIYGIKASAPQLQRLTEGDADEFAPVWKH